MFHGIAWYCMVLHGTAWYCMVLRDGANNDTMYVYKVGFTQQSAEYMIAIDIIFTRAVI